MGRRGLQLLALLALLSLTASAAGKKKPPSAAAGAALDTDWLLAGMPNFQEQLWERVSQPPAFSLQAVGFRGAAAA